jgi:hypothetical protein
MSIGGGRPGIERLDRSVAAPHYGKDCDFLRA